MRFLRFTVYRAKVLGRSYDGAFAVSIVMRTLKYINFSWICKARKAFGIHGLLRRSRVIESGSDAL